jgi:LacI family transcriptional regulator
LETVAKKWQHWQQTNQTQLGKVGKMSENSEPVAPKRNGSAGNPAPTIYDIAKLAGVNPSTVSRALSTPGRISAKTEAKIKAAAKELNYRVNPFARALPTGRTKMIAFMVADITNPVFFQAVRGAEKVATEAGYTMVIAESQESSLMEADMLERILPAVDGVILATSRLGDDQIRTVNDEKPVVLLNRLVDGVVDVVANNEPGIKQAIQHLAEFGHKHIGFLSGPSASWINGERWKFIMRAAVAAGMTVVEIGPNEPTLFGGGEGLDRVLASGVTAVIAYNDLMGIGLMREAQSRGLSIPGDLSVIGFDNVFGSDFTSPPLSTIVIPMVVTGEDAAKQLLNILSTPEGSPLENVPPQVQTSLLARGSSGSPKA